MGRGQSYGSDVSVSLTMDRGVHVHQTLRVAGWGPTFCDDEPMLEQLRDKTARARRVRFPARPRSRYAELPRDGAVFGRIVRTCMRWQCNLSLRSGTEAPHKKMVRQKKSWVELCWFSVKWSAGALR
jgi:hypothetical protein